MTYKETLDGLRRIVLAWRDNEFDDSIAYVLIFDELFDTFLSKDELARVRKLERAVKIDDPSVFFKENAMRDSSVVCNVCQWEGVLAQLERLPHTKHDDVYAGILFNTTYRWDYNCPKCGNRVYSFSMGTRCV